MDIFRIPVLFINKKAVFCIYILCPLMLKQLDQYPPILKIKWMVVIISLLIFCAWKFSFSETWNLYSLYKKNKIQLNLVSSAPAQIAQLEAQIVQLENGLQAKAYNRKELFEEINNFCRNQNLQIVNFFPEQEEVVDGYKIITNRVQVTGSFKNIVQLTYFIEMGKKLGHISSSSIIKQTDLRSKQVSLVCDLFIQHYLTSTSN